MGIISIDGHVTGSRSDFRPYVESKYLGVYDEWATSLDALGEIELGNLKADLGPSAQWDSQRRIDDLESVGVIAEVLFPNGLPFQRVPFVDAGKAGDPELRRQANIIYNRWLADFCAEVPGRRAGQAVISFDDVDQAVTDVYWAKEHGLGGIMMPALTDGSSTYFFDPVLDPIWRAIQDVGLPLSQHGGTGAPTYSPPGYAMIMTLALEHSFFSGRSLWQLIYGGVFHRFPHLKVVFVETESDWVGRILQKIDRRLALGDDWLLFAKALGWVRPFDLTASEYWANNCYAGLSPFNATTEASIDEIVGEPGTNPDGTFCFGTSRSMFGVDYPHFEAIFPGTNDATVSLVGDPRVSESQARRILYENAAEVYGFDLAVLQPHIDRIGFTTDELVGTAGDADGGAYVT